MAFRIVLALSFVFVTLAPEMAAAKREPSEQSVRSGEGKRVRRERKKTRKAKRMARRQVDHETDEAIAAHLREVTAGPTKQATPAPTPPPPEKPTMVTKANQQTRQRRLEPTYDRLVRLHGQIPKGE